MSDNQHAGRSPLTRQLDMECDAFETAWRAGRQPRIEDYLTKVDEASRLRLFEELLLAEIELRTCQGSETNRGDYIERFPEFAHLIDAYLNEDGTARSASGKADSEVTRASQEQESSLTGKTLSDYKIIGHLGSGGMGQVYLARDPRLGRNVALKLLRAEFTTDRSRLRRFEKEARAASALNHPNIVTIHDIGEAEEGRFIVMEYVEGRTLRAVDRQQLSLHQLAEVGVQIAKALCVSHAKGIVHRDIKPANIMVRDDGYVKVLDFGLVRLIPGTVMESGPERKVPDGVDRAALVDMADSASDTDGLLGTVSYMSPEQARGQTVSSASDIFSLGIILYELATAQHPFGSGRRDAVLHSIITREPTSLLQLNPELSERLDMLVLRMLEKDPHLRPGAPEVEARLAELAQPSVPGLSRGTAFRSKSHTVGRKEERDKLCAGLDAVTGGLGLLLCVTGEPGIGKTTLVEEFLAELTATGTRCQTTRGRCSERLAGTEAYLPFFESLDSMLHGPFGESVSHAMKSMAPTWYVQLAPLSEEDSSSADRLLIDTKFASQERMKRELAALLSEISRDQPLIMFLEDMHWVDVASVELLAHLANRFDSMRVLVVATYRPAELLFAEHPLVQVKLDLQGRRSCREISLEFLNRDEVDRYLALEFPGHAFPVELATLIHAKTEGNPLFMVDLVRYLRDRDVVSMNEGRWELVKSLPDLPHELPESMRSMIERTIDRLSDADRRLLIMASVQGYQFDAAVVAEAMKIDAAEAEEQLEPLDRVHSLVRMEQEHELPDATLTVRYRFVHVLYQNVLYASLAPASKASRSLAVARALLRYYGQQSDEIAGELAYLFETARDFKNAYDFLLRAAGNASRVYANEEALQLLGRAISSAERLEGIQRHQCTLNAGNQRAQLLRTLSRFDDASDDFALAEESARQSGSVEAEIDAICGRAMTFLWSKRLPEMRQEGERALEIGQAADSKVGMGSAELVLGAHHFCESNFDEADEYFDRSIPLLRSAVPRRALDAVTQSALVHFHRLNYQGVERDCQWLDQHARESGDCFTMLFTFFYRGYALGNQGRLSDALGLLHEGTRIADLNGASFFLARFPNMIAWLHRELSDMETSLYLDTENVQIAKETGIEEAEANAHVNLGHSYLLLDEPGRALEHLQQAEQIYNTDNWYRFKYNIRLQAELASYWIGQDDLAMASTHAHATLRLADRLSNPKHRAWGYKLLADISTLEERVDDARQEYQTALGILAQSRCPTIEWKILRAAANVAQKMKESDTAENLRGRARTVVRLLADSAPSETLRRTFLASRWVRDL